MRADRLSLCVAMMALFLSVSMFTPHSVTGHTNDPRPAAFPAPLLSVNDSQTTGHHVQIGAWGNQDSVGNEGVQVEILTNSYNASGQDAFWVGDVVSNGAFVQYGYSILPSGYYCLSGHVIDNGTSCTGIADNVGFSDARWFWEYFPNMQTVSDWYYGFGSANSAGINDTWHLYTILPSASGDWSFELDGLTVYSTNFPSATSSAAAHVVAEKAAGSYLTQLGPVEFRNLAYLGNDTLWHGTSSLNPIDGCGYGDSMPCNMIIPYGVAAVRANDIVAGSNVSAPVFDQPIWVRQSSCSMYATLTAAADVGTAPLNVTFKESVAASNGNVSTDWWFGDGSYQHGNSSQTVTYRTPGNFTPFVRVLDSAGCLSEATGSVSVAAPNTTTVVGTIAAPPLAVPITLSAMNSAMDALALRKVPI